MSNRRFLMATVLLFLAGALPFLMLQPTAAASAGLNMGFSAPLEHAGMLVLLVILGIAAAFLPREGMLLLPIAFTLMVMVGAILELDVRMLAALRYFVLGAVVCMGLLLAITREKLTVVSLLVLGSLGFHLGGYFMRAIPTIASPMYFMLGILISTGMVLAISLAFGITVVGNNEATWQRIKQSAAFLRLRDLV